MEDERRGGNNFLTLQGAAINQRATLRNSDPTVWEPSAAEIKRKNKTKLANNIRICRKTQPVLLRCVRKEVCTEKKDGTKMKLKMLNCFQVDRNSRNAAPPQR